MAVFNKKQVFCCFSSEVVATVALFCDKYAKRQEKLSQIAQKTVEICTFTENQVPLQFGLFALPLQ